MTDVYQYYQTMHNDKIILCYKGKLTSELIFTLLQFAEAKFYALKTDYATRKKIINILVETLQNIYHHSDLNKEQESIVMIGKEQENYVVVTGNYIAEENIEGLIKRIEEANELNDQALREKYRTILDAKAKTEPQLGTGAGIGILDIARRSGQKIDYSLHPIDENKSFFTLEVKISEKIK
ncbi:MAG: biofilm formation regulator kinase SiaB [Candidatus Dojkabacteria bacterium]